MKKYRTLFTLCITAILCVFAIKCFAEKVTIQPEKLDDMGSGPSTISDLYYPGGINGIGFALGQPNTLTRNDRVLMRFDISHLALEKNIAKRLKKAELRTFVDTSYAQNMETDVKVDHLLYDVSKGFSATDLVNDQTDSVAKPKLPVKSPVELNLDVTSAVKKDLTLGYKYTSYRWTDLTAEKNGNTYVQPWFLFIIADNPQNKPTLTLIFDQGGSTK